MSHRPVCTASPRAIAACTAAFFATVLLAASSTAQTASPAASPVFTAEQLKADVTTLAAPAMEGRRTGTPGNAAARAWIAQQFKAAGLQPFGASFESTFTFEPRRSAGGGASPPPGNEGKQQGINLVGLCRGRGAKDTGALVITAHYDHLGVREGRTYHGADDNASGVSVLLALARQCQRAPWAHDAVFVAFDAEEQGLQGARAFVASPPIPKERLAINVNLDMVARGDKGEIYIAGTSHRPALLPVLQPVAGRARLKVLFGHDSGGGQNDWTTQSDHGAFHAAGVPFIYFGVEDHPDYHQPTDTADKIDSAFFYQSALLILDAVTALDHALPLAARVPNGLAPSPPNGLPRR